MNPNDQYELLSKNARGAVRYCPDCGGMQLRYGNAILGLAPDDIRAFRDAVAIEKETTLYIGDTGAGFIFNAYEVRMINQLLDIAEEALRSQGRFSVPRPDSLRFISRPLTSHAR